jgi:hypothetical protein
MGNASEEYGLSKKAALGFLLGGSAIVLCIGLLVGYIYTTGEMPWARSSEEAPSATPPPVFVPAELSPAEEAALAEAREVEWTEGRMSFRVPADFSDVQITQQSAWYQNPTGTVALVASASPVASRVEPEPFLQALYSQHQPRRKSGAYDQLQYLEIDHVKGLLFRECPTQKAETPRRLQWTGFRDLDGKQETVSIVITGPGADFAKNETLISAMLVAAKLR